jgi:hypothetical protein
MKLNMPCILALALLTAPTVAIRTRRVVEGHPIEKVIEMLKGLIVEVDTEAKAEALTYEKFEYWCKNSVKELGAAITAGKETIDELTSKISGLTETEKVLTAEIADLEDELEKLDKESEKAKEIRTAEAGLYEEADADYGSTIKAIADAIKLLEESKEKTESALLAQQRVQSVLPFLEKEAEVEQRLQLAAFLQANIMDDPKERPKQLAKGDEEKHIDKYSFKSSSVIEMLKTLKLKFEDEEIAANKAETNAINAYDLALNSREEVKARKEDSKKAKSDELSATQSSLEEAKNELGDTKKDLAADESTLEETQKSCAVKASEWAERSDTREKEMEAMKVAIKILAKVTGVRTEAPGNPVPPPSPVKGDALMQLAASDPKMRAVELLRTAAEASHSQAMARLAQEVATHLKDGPFDQINNMIQKMIFRLMAEQKDEDDHKNWCDKELSESETSKADKAEKMEELEDKIKTAKAKVQKLTEAIEDADEMVQKITGHVEEATEIREVGKEENKVAVKDAQDAQKAVAEATSVLETFYKESGMIEKKSYELMQKDPVKLPETPSTWEASYTGVTDPAEQPDGIIAVLKKVSADFAKMEAQTKAQEESDQSLYDEDMKRCAIEKAALTKESDMKGAEKKRKIQKIAQMQATHKHVSDEHAAVVQYLKDLEHGCVDGDSTYEDRKAARAKEIDALGKAQIILRDAFKEKKEEKKE